MCGAHATVRGFLRELVARSPHSHDIVVDMEAGLEHLSRGTGRHVSRCLAVIEPYYRSMETGRRIAQLAAELGIAQVDVITNKIRNAADRDAVAAFCQAHRLAILGEVPYDPALADAERAGTAPLEFDGASLAVGAIRRLSDLLLGGAAPRDGAA